MKKEPALRSHIHLQAAQSPAQSKACKRVCLPNGNAKRTANQADEKEQRRHNSTYPIGGVSCSQDSFVVNQTLVFHIQFCGKSPATSKSPKMLVVTSRNTTH
jgi:hypothetical protein